MAAEDRRIAYVRGLEFIFQREDPEAPQRKLGNRRVVAAWASPLGTDDEWSKATLNEFDDGVFEPSSIPGVFSDFAGAAAVEVTVRWMQEAASRQARQFRRMRDLALGAAFVVAAIAIAVVSFR